MNFRVITLIKRIVISKVHLRKRNFKFSLVESLSVVLVILMLFSLISPNLARAASSQANVKLTGVKGKVFVKKAGGQTEFTAYDGMAISQGDWIRTEDGGTTQILYGNGTKSTLAANTQVTIGTLISDGESTQSSVKLWSGGIWNKVKSLINIDDDYEVETPTAVMGVRGTLYLVSIDPDSGITTVDVMDGTVAGTQNRQRTHSGQEYLVTMGEELVFDSLTGLLSGKQAINLQNLVENVEPNMLVQIVIDLNDQIDVFIEQAKNAQANYNETKDISQIERALALVHKATNLVNFAQKLVDEIESSSNETQVDELLRELEKNLTQLDQEIGNKSQDAQITESQIISTARAGGLTQDRIEELLEGALRASLPPDESKEQPSDVPRRNNNSYPPQSGVQNSTISSNTANFNKSINQQADINLTMNLNGNSLISIKNAQTTLVKDINYATSGSAITIKKEYLETQAPGQIVLVFEFSAGDAATLTINIIDSTSIDLLNVTLSPGSVVGTTQVVSLPSLPVGATKFQFKLQANPFSAPILDDLFAGGTDYSSGENIIASAGEYFLLAAVDNSNKIKAYYTKQLITSMIASESGLTTKIRTKSISTVSVNSEGTQGDGYSSEPSISGDGQRVAFISSAKNLVTDGDDSYVDIFMHDKGTGITEQVNVTSGEVKVPGAGQPVFSSDGRYVAFRSSKSGLVSGDTNSNYDIFVRNLTEGTTVRVSVGTDGNQATGGNFGAGWPSISGDGRYVAFQSDGASLVSGDTTIQDIFVRDRDVDEDGIFDETETGRVRTDRVNLSSGGEPANADCYFPIISRNGRFIIFSSNATNLVPGKSNGLFIRDLQEGKTTFISEGTNPVMSADGRFVAFSADDSSNLVPYDTNGKNDLFIYDRDVNETGLFDETGNTSITRVSLNASGEQLDDHCFSSSVSADGRYVAYDSEATNLVSGSTNGQGNVCLFDRVTGVTKLISASKTGWPANGGSSGPSISSDGKFIAFSSVATNLIENDSNGKGDVFLVELDLEAPIDTEAPVFTPDDGLQAEDIGPSWIKLTWNQAADNLYVKSYALFRGTNPEGPFTQIVTVDGTASSYWDIDLMPDTHYYYYVVAYDEDGNSSTIPTATLIKTGIQPTVIPSTVPIAAGDYHSLARTDEGLVWAWGYNSDGQLGEGTTDVKNSPVLVVGASGSGYLENVAAIAAQGYSSVALKNDGTVWTWGTNDYGLLGIGTEDNYPHSTPVQVRGYQGVGYLTHVVAIATSEYHTLALKSDGTVWAWGNNYEGNLGDGTDIKRLTPVPVKSPDGTGYLTNIIAIAAGDAHSMALKSDGTVWTWGQNAFGQLGNGMYDWDMHSLPSQVPSLSGVKVIAAGQYHSLALKTDKTVFAWGANHYGELGDGTTIRRTSPVQVKGEGGIGNLSGIDSIVGGNHFTLAIKNNQTVWAWGYNDYGQLGRPVVSPYYISTPIQSSGLTDITYVAGGYEHSLAVNSDKKAWAWGYNYYGQLGRGTKDSSEHPDAVEIIGLSLAVDNTSPKVSSTDPVNDTMDINIGKTIEIVFNESIQSTVNFNSISLVEDTATPIVISKVVQGKTLLITAEGDLSFSKSYTINIPAGSVKDLANNPLAADYSFSFTTEAQDLELPQWPARALTAPFLSETSISLEWVAATDNKGIANYRIYKDGLPVETIPGNQFAYTVDELTANTSYTIKVEALDLQGNWSTDGPNITVSTPKELALEIADPLGGAGRYSSIALDSSGTPHISYQDYNSGDRNLKYGYKSGENWVMESVDSSSSDLGSYSSLALDTSNQPHISYRKNNSMDVGLKYAHYNGTSWQVEDVNSIGAEFTSIKVDASSSPRIVYNDSSGFLIKYSYKSGDTWVTDNVGNGTYPSLALDEAGNPHISYYDTTNTALKYAYKGESGWHSITVDDSGSVGAVNSLALDSSGNPHISYLDYTNKQIKYAYKDSSVWHVEKIGAAGTQAFSTSLAIDESGKVYVTYIRYTNDYDHPLIYAFRDSSGWHNVIAHNGNGKYLIEARPAIAVDPLGNIHISYYSSGLEYITDK
ncbi:X2-like carbohydrate binding domain-containing protein [Desulfosporosinus sp.]|uniref:RCC1 domain-containing protein n=1 Tax=Desulfosporosinus sp. TaxID=157907 RepID=UPI0025C57BCF|nr:X2-like carbohydrate binding domain-containing protein [Desulfosporosinus sp.]MBC2727352.1 Ig-like domain-containing protein [Desulfosporosinus sp.]